MAHGSLCGFEGKVGLARSYGAVGRDQPLAALASKSILLWGRNPAENSVHFLAILHDARRAGARLGTIDVRATPTTAAPDRRQGRRKPPLGMVPMPSGPRAGPLYVSE